MKTEFAIRCQNRNCGEWFRFPYPTQEEKSEGLPQSSKGSVRVAFWCWICGFVFEYLIQDCRFVESRTPDQGQQPHDDKHAYRIPFQCAQESCGFPVVVNTIMGSSSTPDEFRWPFRMHGKAVCQQGHEFPMPSNKEHPGFFQIGVEQLVPSIK